MPETVLVGVDGSGPSDAAMEWAIERAVRLGLDLVLLHAADSPRGVASASAASSSFDRAVAAARSRRGINGVVGLAVDGDAMAELIAASADAAIVVVGSHKTGFLRGRVFGSRTLSLVAEAFCPVAVIPEHSGRTRHGVAVEVDGSRAGERALQFAASEAAALGEDLILIHGGQDDDEESVPFGLEAPGRADLILADARELAGRMAPTVRTRLRAVRRTAAVALSDASPSTLLLVLAASSGPRIDGAFGQTTHDVLMNLAGPTLIVPA